MKKLIFGLAILTSVTACNQPENTATPAPPAVAATDMKALFEKNLSSLKEGISAFEKGGHEWLGGICSWPRQVVVSGVWCKGS